MGSESKQVPELKNPADASEALNKLLENGEISAEAYAEYSTTADAALSSSTGSSPHTRQAARHQTAAGASTDTPTPAPKSPTQRVANSRPSRTTPPPKIQEAENPHG